MKPAEVGLGDRVEDRISGFSGIAIARCEWLYGCVRVTVQPEKLKDGKLCETQTFDEPQLKVTKRAVVEHRPEPAAPRTYGPRNDKAALSRN